MKATLKDKRPVYALLGAPTHSGRHSGIRTPEWCEPCEQANVERHFFDGLAKELSEPEAWGEKILPQHITCYYTRKVQVKIRVDTPLHCQTCKCPAEYRVADRYKMLLRPGHGMRCGVAWRGHAGMRRFLQSFGTTFVEYWTTGSVAKNCKYRVRDWSNGKGATLRYARRVRSTMKRRVAYAFPDLAAAKRFVRARIAAHLPLPGDREDRMRFELAFWSWARLATRRFVGTYENR